MRYKKLIILLFLIASCSSSKRISETTSKEVSKTVKTTDSISENITPIEETTPKPIVVVKINKPDIEAPPIKAETTEKVNHHAWHDLLQKYVSNKGHVNYKGLKNNRNALLNYITVLGKNTPNDLWTKADKLAYWINAYNAFTIDLILQNYPVKSIKDIKNPWKQRLWKLGSKWYNLEEIEHQILRKMDEPRIHFAIVCASFSCPKLQNEAFTASNIESQLTLATTEFLNDSARNTISKNSLELSKIFQWFAKDFKQNPSLIDFLNQYSTIEISAKAKKSFKNYNWDLNE
ncbi:hypothetical protein GCM10023314_23330 [Algibacter agarivorans]|uniref:DUF547 domain-containing protein n=1 Tax=Algibacter agarivorans TaxID=1109741 RepID=A0ABP9GP60_9FLAO